MTTLPVRYREGNMMGLGLVTVMIIFTGQPFPEKTNLRSFLEKNTSQSFPTLVCLNHDWKIQKVDKIFTSITAGRTNICPNDIFRL